MLKFRTAAGILTALTFWPVPATAQDHLERDFQARFCAGLVQNRYLPNGTYVDCISTTHAIEVEFSQKWAEAIGQALMYASELERRPGIIVICRPETSPSVCLKHAYLIEQTVTYWRIGMSVWYCTPEDISLTDCRYEDLMGP